MKLLYFDTETTGLDVLRHNIVEIAMIVEIDKEVVYQTSINMQPITWDNISSEALEVTGLTIEKLKTFQTPQAGYQQILTVLDKYIDKYNTADKFHLAGYNVNFDLDMLQSLFKAMGNNYLGSYITWRCLDPYHHVQEMIIRGEINPVNAKLETIANLYQIPIEAHNALSDALAARELIYKMGILK